MENFPLRAVARYYYLAVMLALVPFLVALKAPKHARMKKHIRYMVYNILEYALLPTALRCSIHFVENVREALVGQWKAACVLAEKGVALIEWSLSSHS